DDRHSSAPRQAASHHASAKLHLTYLHPPTPPLVPSSDSPRFSYIPRYSPSTTSSQKRSIRHRGDETLPTMDPSAPSTAAAPPSAAQEPVREEDLFIAFDTYPWIKDPKFMVSSPSPPSRYQTRDK